MLVIYQIVSLQLLVKEDLYNMQKLIFGYEAFCKKCDMAVAGSSPALKAQIESIPCPICATITNLREEEL